MKICSECHRCYDDVVEQCSEWHGPLSVSRPGSVSMVAGYRVEERLYSGLRGDLFRATRTDCDRKCLIRTATADTKITEAFLDEAKIVTDLYHPNLVAVYEYGTTDSGECFAVFEDSRGEETLRDLLDRKGAPGLLESIQIVRMIAETLDELHKAGIIFRALSPDNVLISEDSSGGTSARLKDIDLGGTAQHAIVSNKFLIDTEIAAIRYFAPEQCLNEPATVQSDVYSLGVLLYELIAGSPPFDADRAAGVIEQHRHARPPEIKIDNFDLRMLISHALMESLSKQANLRQASADLFARQLRHIEQLATHVSTPAPVVKVAPSAAKPATRVITLAESGLDLAEPNGLDVVVSSSPIARSEAIEPQPNYHHAPISSCRVPIEAEESPVPMRQIDPDGIKQIDFRAARERMKDLLAATPATQVAPGLIRLDEPLDEIPSIDEALDVLRSDGDLTPEFEAMEQSSETRKVPGETPLAESFAHVPTVPTMSHGLTSLHLADAPFEPTKDTLETLSADDDEIFESIKSFSEVRFARLRRGIAVGAAAGVIALAFTFRADIVDAFTPFDLGKLEPPRYKPATSSEVPPRQTSEVIYETPAEPAIVEPAPVVANDQPRAVMMISDRPKVSEGRISARRAPATTPETRMTQSAPLKQRPEAYKPENVVITYPDPKARAGRNERDPFAKPKPATGMTRPRIVANPNP